VTLAVKMIVSALLYGFWFTLFLWLIYTHPFFQRVSPGKHHLAFFFLLKVAAGILLTCIYTFYYTDQTRSDIYRYFNDSQIIADIIFQSPKAWLKIMSGYGTYHPDAFTFLVKTQNFSHSSSDFTTNNTLIIRVSVMLNYLTGYSIWGNTLLLNMLSFSGLVAFYYFLKPYFAAYPYILFFPLFLLPDVVFWNSGLLKGQLMFTCLGWFYYLLSHKAWWKIITHVLILALIYSIKPMLAIALMLSFPFLYLHQFRWSKAMLAAVFSLIVVGVILLSRTGFTTGTCDFIVKKHNEFIELATAGKAGSLLTSIPLSDCRDLFLRFPILLFETVLGPSVWNSPNLMSKLFGGLNLLLVLVLMALLMFFYQTPNRFKLSLSVSLIVFAAVQYMTIALAVPVVGAMVHYRTLAIPFVVIAVLNLITLEKFIFVFRPALKVLFMPLSAFKSDKSGN